MLFLFDIDGVVNKSPYFTENYVSEFGTETRLFDDFFQKDFLPTLSNKSDLLEILPKHFVKWKWERNAEEFLEYWFKHDVKIDMELILLIRHYRRLGHKVGIASQQEKYRKIYLLNSCGLADEFDSFYFSCDLGCLKSSNFFYYTIIQNEKQPIYFWDDTPEVIEKANHCGFQAFLYLDNQKLKQQIDDIIKHNEF
jgi:FMN phosphatase YigB (HAD superfamily)